MKAQGSAWGDLRLKHAAGWSQDRRRKGWGVRPWEELRVNARKERRKYSY